MDKLQWFKFTPSDWMMGKIQRCTEITQARFIRLCCLYWNKECELSIEDAIIEIDKEHYDVLVLKKIISIGVYGINISFLDEQNLEILETSKDKSKSGIVGNLKRWHPLIYNRFIRKEISLEKAIELSKTIATQSHTDNTPIAPQSQNIADKIKTIQDEEKKRVDDLPTREKIFKDSCRPFITEFTTDLVKSFFNYWSEPTQDNKKMRFELEKTFDVKRRLTTWKNNESKFGLNKTEIKNQPML